MIVKLLRHIGSKKEVEQYLKHYSSVDSPKFAVIKVGGGVLEDDLETFSSSLSFLHSVGLVPVVIHGAGPQLNAALAKAGIESDYINGMRITTPEILRHARAVFQRVNLKLVKALEDRGTRSRPILSGIFEAEFLNKEKLGFVGQVTKVHVDQVHHSLQAGQLPIITCVGESSTGQILNINADVAAHELAKSLRPLKIVYISSNGGLRDNKGQLIDNIDLDTDYDVLMNQDWFKHGNRLKLREIKALLDELPPSSSVSITDAVSLPKELFTHRGSGTLVRRSEKMVTFTSLDDADTTQLRNLIEQSFEGKLMDDYFDFIKDRVWRIYLSENYRAVAILLKDKSDPNAVPYLDKFAVVKTNQSEGLGNRLWQQIVKENPQLYWRSRATNPINSWYFERAQGTVTKDNWTVFWYGLDMAHADQFVQRALQFPTSIQRSVIMADPAPGTGAAQKRSFHTLARAGASSASQRPRSFLALGRGQARSFSSGSARLGLIGARGHTGSELVHLIAKHPSLQLTVAGSRALKGQRMADAIPSLSQFPQCGFRDLEFVDVTADNVAQFNVDAWVLALPNNLAAPYVAALDKAGSKAKIVDLSADYRFDKTWAYGLVERKGQRAQIRASSRIANPGCYATGAQLSLLPLEGLLDESYAPSVFGISGYSGAGTTPSRKNDTKALADNLMPYTLTGHMHEKEVSSQLQSFLSQGVRFMPHVAPWFRGISLTIATQLRKPVDKSEIVQRFRDYYAGEPLVQVIEDIPEVRDNVPKHHVKIGGFAVNGQRLVICTTLDNLLKGAATQCMQNVNLSLGFPELSGIQQP